MTMNPGTELDRLIATKLFGFDVHPELPIMFETPDSDFTAIIGYSTTWNGMQLVVEEMQRRGYKINIYITPQLTIVYISTVLGLQVAEVSSESAPMAVALASLAALEGQADET